MAAIFEVHRASVDALRELLVLEGVVVDGMVRTGMSADPEGASPDGFPAPVHSVEFMERTAGEADSVEPALTFHFRDPGKLKALAEHDWDEVRLTLSY